MSEPAMHPVARTMAAAPPHYEMICSECVWPLKFPDHDQITLLVRTRWRLSLSWRVSSGRE